MQAAKVVAADTGAASKVEEAQSASVAGDAAAAAEARDATTQKTGLPSLRLAQVPPASRRAQTD